MIILPSDSNPPPSQTPAPGTPPSWSLRCNRVHPFFFLHRHCCTAKNPKLSYPSAPLAYEERYLETSSRRPPRRSGTTSPAPHTSTCILSLPTRPEHRRITQKQPPLKPLQSYKTNVYGVYGVYSNRLSPSPTPPTVAEGAMLTFRLSLCYWLPAPEEEDADVPSSSLTCLLQRRFGGIGWDFRGGKIQLRDASGIKDTIFENHEQRARCG